MVMGGKVAGKSVFYAWKGPHDPFPMLFTVNTFSRPMQVAVTRTIYDSNFEIESHASDVFMQQICPEAYRHLMVVLRNLDLANVSVLHPCSLPTFTLSMEVQHSLERKQEDVIRDIKLQLNGFTVNRFWIR